MGMGGMSLPIGMTRRALSYDDNMEAPMSPPPSDININNLWRRPVIPDRKFQQLAEVTHTHTNTLVHSVFVRDLCDPLVVCPALRRMSLEAARPTLPHSPPALPSPMSR